MTDLNRKRKSGLDSLIIQVIDEHEILFRDWQIRDPFTVSSYRSVFLKSLQQASVGDGFVVNVNGTAAVQIRKPDAAIAESELFVLVAADRFGQHRFVDTAQMDTIYATVLHLHLHLHLPTR